MSSVKVNTAALEKDAEKLLKEAKKIGTKGFFNRHPDYHSAGKKAEEAANKLRLASHKLEAADALAQAAEYYRLGENANPAARQYEAAAQIMIEVGEYDRAVELYMKAQEMHRINGNHQKAGEILTKAGKTLTETCPEKTFELFQTAIEIYTDEDAAPFAEDSFQYYLIALLRAKNYELAIKEMPRRIEIDKQLRRMDARNRSIFILIILRLAVEGSAQAMDSYQAYDGEAGFSDSNEAEAASQLLASVQMGDEESLKTVLKKQIFNFLPRDVLALAKTIKVEEGGHQHLNIIMGAAAPADLRSSTPPPSSSTADEEPTTTTTTSSSSSSSSDEPAPAPAADEPEEGEEGAEGDEGDDNLDQIL